MNKDEQQILDYLKKNQDKARELAMQFQQISKNWFTIDYILKKTGNQTNDKAREEVWIKLLALKASDLCISKLEGDEEKFKIIFDNEKKIRFLQDQIGQLENTKKMYELEIERLKDNKTST